MTTYLYDGEPVGIYTYKYLVGTKNNTYKIFISLETGSPVLFEFIGFDNLFGSHYDQYIIKYTSFSSTPPDPDVFKYQESKYVRFVCGSMLHHFVKTSLDNILPLMYTCMIV